MARNTDRAMTRNVMPKVNRTAMPAVIRKVRFAECLRARVGALGSSLPGVTERYAIKCLPFSLDDVLQRHKVVPRGGPQLCLVKGSSSSLQ